MRGAIVGALILFGIGLAWAATTPEIRCAVFSNGAGTAIAANHGTRAIVGQPSVKAAISAQHRLTPGGLGCAVPTVSTVSVETELPSILRLYGNAPNPFNPRTTIAFDLPRDSAWVSLRIYDLSGRLIRVLRDGPESAGRKEVVWDGTCLSGSGTVASGVYIYQLENDGRRLTRKMTLLK